jgi:hypothetical protein
MIKFPVNLHYGASTHCTLKYANMKGCPITEDDLLAMFPNRFSDRYYARRAMESLAKCGYAKQIGNTIQITGLGQMYLAKVAKQYVGEMK